MRMLIASLFVLGLFSSPVVAKPALSQTLGHVSKLTYKQLQWINEITPNHLRRIRWIGKLTDEQRWIRKLSERQLLGIQKLIGKE